MPSIFPGVDPYIEAQGYWPDFHTTAIVCCRDALVDGLPDRYHIRIEERVQLLEGPAEPARMIRPDLAIERPWPRQQEQGGAVALAVEVEVEVEPEIIPVVILEEVRTVYLEILHRPDRKLVTIVELLSPDDKAGSGHGLYAAKRNSILRGPSHLVELDFLVGGKRIPTNRPLPKGDYFAIVARGDRRPDADVYARTVRQTLPKIRIPLLAPDPDLTLDLSALYATSFDRGRYDRSIDYAAPLAIGLAPEDRAWAEALAKGVNR